MSSDELSDQAAPPRAKSKLGIYLLIAAWGGAWALVIAQIVAPL